MKNKSKNKNKEVLCETIEKQDPYRLFYEPYQYITKLTPTKAINEHAKMVKKTVTTTKRMFESYMKQDFKRAAELYPKVRLAEFEADNIKSIILDKCHRRFFSSLTKDDMGVFLKELDAVADSAEHLADILAVKNTIIPGNVKELLTKHIDIVDCSISILVDVVEELGTLIKRVFRKRDVDEVLQKLHQVGLAEHEADKVKFELKRCIYGLEDVDPIDIYHMLKIVDYSDSIADHAENVEGRIRMIVSQY